MNHNFDVDIAKQYGLDEAIVIANFQHWINHNAKNGKNYYEGRYWTFNSYKALSAIFPYWSEKQVRRIMNSLIDNGVLIVGNFNQKEYDCTKWYAFANEIQWITPVAQTGRGMPKRAGLAADQLNTPVAQTGRGGAQMGNPIPSNKPYSKPVNKRKSNNLASADASALPGSNSDSGNSPPPVPPVAPPPREDKDKLPEGLYPLMVKAYFDWWKARTGHEPSMPEKEFKALKEMTKYFYRVKKNYAASIKEIVMHEQLVERAATSFTNMLLGFNGEHLETFIRTQTDCTQIYSNLNKIIDQLKNGNPKNKQQQQRRNDLSGVDAELAAELGITPHNGQFHAG